MKFLILSPKKHKESRTRSLAMKMPRQLVDTKTLIEERIIENPKLCVK